MRRTHWTIRIRRLQRSFKMYFVQTGKICFSFALLLFGFVSLQGSEKVESNVFASNTQHFALDGNWHKVDMPSEFETWSICSGKGRNVWFGSTNEIARYDGILWERIPLDSEIMEGPVKAIHHTESGRIYALTPSGFYQLNGNEWEQISTVKSDLFSRSAIFESSNGSIWVGHDSGISVLRPDGTFVMARSGEKVITICEDIEGGIWMVQGEYREVYRLKKHLANNGSPTLFEWERMLESYEEPMPFVTLLSTPDGHVRVGDFKRNDMTRYFDLKSNQWYDFDLSYDFGSNEVADMIMDQRGRIWISTNGKLLVIDGLKRTTFSYPWVPMPQDATRLEIADDGSLWITTNDSGPIRIDLEEPSWEIFENYLYQCHSMNRDWFIRVDGKVVSIDNEDRDDPKIQLHSGEAIIEHPLSIFSDSNDRIWVIGSHRDSASHAEAAVSIYDGVQWQLLEFPEFATGFDYDSFCELADGRFLLGCGQFWDFPYYKRGGLLELREVEGNWVTKILPAEPLGLPDRIHEIVSKSNGDILVGGSQLTLLKDGRSRIINESLGQINLWPSAVKRAPDDVIWGASFGRGVFRIENDNYRWFHAFDNGLEDASIIDLAVLKNGDPVALTPRAVYRYDGQNWVESLRLPLEFPLSEGAGTLKVANDGTLWINLVHASWYFQWVQDSSGYSDQVIPRFRSLRYRFDAEEPQTFIEPSTTSSDINTSFSGKIGGWDRFSKTSRRDLQFSYRVDQNPWTPFSDNDTIEIQQLSEGRHIIEARSRDLDFNIDSTGASIALNVQIPMWKKKWFIPMIIALIIFSLVSYLVIIRNRARYLLELEHQKLSFFTNLTHEIRTPLAKVVAPIERALALDNSSELNRYLRISQRSLGELTRIVDQLLDFRRAQSGVMSSSPEHVELVGMVADFVRSMEIIAKEKNQHLVFESRVSSLDCRVDAVKIKSILNNLVLNSIRYSPMGAQIRVQLREADIPNEVILCVEDRGYGMDTNIVKHAFEPFRRGTSESIRKTKGTGIGLAYVNELIKIIKGSIVVESPVVPTDKETPGTRVTLQIPIKTQSPPTSEVEEVAMTPADAMEPSHEEPQSKPVLLIAEDDHELAEFLKHELENEFWVLLEPNGADALKRASESIPDIMVVDRMMPKMDGFELCKRIRSSELLEHIPIIMLTAASSQPNELEALKSGVNDFVGKPFSVETLIHRIRNQLSIRDSAREKIKREIEASFLSKEAEKIEDPFVRRVIEIVDSSLSDYQFGTDQLGDTLTMSRSTLYRKIGATFNMSPPDLIRSRRMLKAGTLLIGTKSSVTEVMESVGIIEHRTFNKWFKSTYHCSPTEFRKQNSQA